MERAKLWAESQGDVGAWFPSLSEDEPTAVRAALSDVNAARCYHKYDTRPSRVTTVARRAFWAQVTAVLALVAVPALFPAAGVLVAASGSVVAPLWCCCHFSVVLAGS